MKLLEIDEIYHQYLTIDQDNEFDYNKLTDLDSITVNKDPSSDKERPNKKYVDDSIGGGNIL